MAAFTTTPASMVAADMPAAVMEVAAMAAATVESDHGSRLSAGWRCVIVSSSASPS
jgi:hypothetical protein